MEQAISLAENDLPDTENIKRLGEGWTGEESLAIAIYCALRHADDFSAAVVAAVNHSGDSDSTGAVTGNIVGAWLGYDAIDEKWKRLLELKSVILEMADDLAQGCRIAPYDAERGDPVWECKYVYGRHAKTVDEANALMYGRH